MSRGRGGRHRTSGRHRLDVVPPHLAYRPVGLIAVDPWAEGEAYDPLMPTRILPLAQVW